VEAQQQLRVSRFLPSTSGASPHATTISHQNINSGNALAEWARLIFILFVGNDLAADTVWAAVSFNLARYMTPSFFTWLHSTTAGVMDSRPCAHLDGSSWIELDRAWL
jgi:hypothetical protein